MWSKAKNRGFTYGKDSHRADANCKVVIKRGDLVIYLYSLTFIYNIFVKHVTNWKFYRIDISCIVTYKLVENVKKISSMANLSKYYTQFYLIKCLHFVRHIPVYFFMS